MQKWQRRIYSCIYRVIFRFQGLRNRRKKCLGKSFLSNSVQIHRSNLNRSGSFIHSNKTSLMTKCFSSNCSTLWSKININSGINLTIPHCDIHDKSSHKSGWNHAWNIEAVKSVKCNKHIFPTALAKSFVSLNKNLARFWNFSTEFSAWGRMNFLPFSFQADLPFQRLFRETQKYISSASFFTITTSMWITLFWR